MMYLPDLLRLHDVKGVRKAARAVLSEGGPHDIMDGDRLVLEDLAAQCLSADDIFSELDRMAFTSKVDCLRDAYGYGRF
jgi:hypothetical protein